MLFFNPKIFRWLWMYPNLFLNSVIILKANKGFSSNLGKILFFPKKIWRDWILNNFKLTEKRLESKNLRSRKKFLDWGVGRNVQIFSLLYPMLRTRVGRINVWNKIDCVRLSILYLNKWNTWKRKKGFVQKFSEWFYFSLYRTERDSSF